MPESGYIELEHVWKCHNGLTVLRDFSLQLEQGRIHCLFGPSGCGKTTLLHLLAGLKPPDQGKVTGMAEEAAIVFQETRLLPWLTVEENLVFVLESRISRQEARAIARRELAMAGLADFASAYPKQLSGGMQQRAALARALASGADTLLLDEPFKGLNYSLKQACINRVLDYQDNQGQRTQGASTTILVTHDADEALLMADAILMLQGPPLKLQARLDIPVPRRKRAASSNLLLEYRKLLTT